MCRTNCHLRGSVRALSTLSTLSTLINLINLINPQSVTEIEEDLRTPINPLTWFDSNVLKVRRVDVLQRDVDLDAFPLAEFQKLRFP